MLAAVLASCSKPSSGADASAASSQAPAADSEPDAALRTAHEAASPTPASAHHECFDKGPLHCDVSAVDEDAGVCETLGSCLKQRRARTDGSVPEVGDELHKVVACNEVARTSVGSAAGAHTVALVTLQAETGDAKVDPNVAVGSGAYLISIHEGRACPSAEVLTFFSPRHGWYEDSYVLRPDNRLGRVHTAASRIERISLDQDEMASGTSNIEYQGCDQYIHAVQDGALVELRHRHLDGPVVCDAPRAPSYIVPQPHVEQQLPAGAAQSCAGAGPIACDTPPSRSSEELCAQIRRCVEARGRHEEWQLSKVSECSEILQETSLPSAPSLGSVAVIQARGSSGKKPAHSAYLVQKRAEGFCLLDQLFDAVAGETKTPGQYEIAWSESDRSVDVSSMHVDRFKRSKDGQPAGQGALGATEIVRYRLRNGALVRFVQSTVVQAQE